MSWWWVGFFPQLQPLWVPHPAVAVSTERLFTGILFLCPGKQKQLQNLEDACDDIMLLDDADSHLIPYQIGDVFISHSLEETQEMLEEAKVCVTAGLCWALGWDLCILWSFHRLKSMLDLGFDHSCKKSCSQTWDELDKRQLLVGSVC